MSQFTDGRTESLKEMTQQEYDEMCDCLHQGRPAGMSRYEYEKELRYYRSGVLKRLQKLGVNTADDRLVAVNQYCQSPRIAGKPFGLLTIDELKNLIPKLEAMLKKKVSEQQHTQYENTLTTMPIFYKPSQIPS